MGRRIHDLPIGLTRSLALGDSRAAPDVLMGPISMEALKRHDHLSRSLDTGSSCLAYNEHDVRLAAPTAGHIQSISSTLCMWVSFLTVSILNLFFRVQCLCLMSLLESTEEEEG